MGYIYFCSLCKYAYTEDCECGGLKCIQEKARIMVEVSNKIKQKERTNDVPTE